MDAWRTVGNRTRTPSAVRRWVSYDESLYDPHMLRTRASARWMRFALAFALALGLAVASAAQQHILTNGQNLQIPINHGLPDKPLGFTFCRLRYQKHPQGQKVRLGRRLSASGLQLHGASLELTRAPISRWNNGDPGFANVTATDPNLFQMSVPAYAECGELRLQP